jgi:uncharacterized damage-inducible protein DinB
MDTQHWLVQIDQTTESFQKAFGQLNEDELNWKPDAGTWSVAQNLHHLIVINETYYPVLKRAREGSQKLPWVASVGFMVRFFGNFILKSVEPARKKKMKTFPLWEPSKSKIAGNIVQKFAEHQVQLKILIQESSDLLDKGTIISSPANRSIVYTLAQAFDIIITHEQRHFNQSVEVNALRLKGV